MRLRYVVVIALKVVAFTPSLHYSFERNPHKSIIAVTQNKIVFSQWDFPSALIIKNWGESKIAEKGVLAWSQLKDQYSSLALEEQIVREELGGSDSFGLIPKDSSFCHRFFIHHVQLFACLFSRVAGLGLIDSDNVGISKKDNQLITYQCNIWNGIVLAIVKWKGADSLSRKRLEEVYFVRPVYEDDSDNCRLIGNW
jgi:hypothetical protein